jgi:hypothetical protein
VGRRGWLAWYARCEGVVAALVVKGGGRDERKMGKLRKRERHYVAPALENLVTDLVPSEIACFESSPGRIRRTAVWISRDEMVDFLE